MKFNYMIVFSAAVFAFASCDRQTTIKTGTPLQTELDSISYSLGVSIGHNLRANGMDTINYEIFISALHDVLYANEPVIKRELAQKMVAEYLQEARIRLPEKNRKAGEQFLEKNKDKQGVVTLPSGLQYKIIREGTGEKPSLEDNINVYFTGRLIDGTVFDNNPEGEPVVFPMSYLIKGWQEALQMMGMGAKWNLYVPSELAYGERGKSPVIGPNEALVFEVELVEVIHPSEENDE